MRTVELKSNGREYLVIDLPLNRHPINISGNFLVTRLNSVGETVGLKSYELPHCNFKTIGFIKDLTEEQWGVIITSVFGRIGSCEYINFKMPFIECIVHTATESGKSWLISHGIDETFVNPFLIEKI